MKKLRLLTPVVLIAGVIGISSLQSCTKLAKNLQYDLDLQMGTVQVAVPITSDTTVAISASQMNYYNVDSFIKANTANVLGLSNITSAKIKSCYITIDSPANDELNNFANFKSAGASVYSNNNTTPYTLSIPNNPDVMAQTLTLPVDTTTELKSYLSGTNFTYTLTGALRRPTTKVVNCTVHFAFTVHVQG